MLPRPKQGPPSLSLSNAIQGLGLILNMTYRRWSIRKEVFLLRTAERWMKSVSGRRSRGKGKERDEIRSLVCARLCFTSSVADHCILAIALDSAQSLKCRECDSLDIDHQLRKVFKCLVCKKCQNDKPERYSLLTKTECKEASRCDSILWLIFPDGGVGLSLNRPRNARRGSIAALAESQPA